MLEDKMYIEDKPHKNSKFWQLSSYVTGCQDRIVTEIKKEWILPRITCKDWWDFSFPPLGEDEWVLFVWVIEKNELSFCFLLFGNLSQGRRAFLCVE